MLGWNHSLSCTGAGSTLCGWTVAPSFDNGITATEVEDWVLNEIDNSGNESGSVTYNNLVYVEWSTDADGKITIMMTDEL